MFYYLQKASRDYFQANDWSKRAVLMTPDFVYYSYTEEADEEIRERSEVVTSRAPVAQKLSELHLAEPWVKTWDAATLLLDTLRERKL